MAKPVRIFLWSKLLWLLSYLFVSKTHAFALPAAALAMSLLNRGFPSKYVIDISFEGIIMNDSISGVGLQC